MFGGGLSLYGWQALMNMAGQTTSVASSAQENDSSDLDEFLRLKHFQMALDIVATEMVSTLSEAQTLPQRCPQKQLCVQHL